MEEPRWYESSHPALFLWAAPGLVTSPWSTGEAALSVLGAAWELSLTFTQFQAVW